MKKKTEKVFNGLLGTNRLIHTEAKQLLFSREWLGIPAA